MDALRHHGDEFAQIGFSETREWPIVKTNFTFLRVPGTGQKL